MIALYNVHKVKLYYSVLRIMSYFENLYNSFIKVGSHSLLLYVVVVGIYMYIIFETVCIDNKLIS